MHSKPMLSLLVVALCAAQAADRSPVYKLLYSPPFGVPGGNPTTMFEVNPGLFYVLGVEDTNTFGTSIFTVTSAGALKSIYTFPSGTDIFALGEGTNGALYGPGFVGQTKGNFYFSMDLSGKDLAEYPPPGKWGSVGFMVVAPPGQIYDILAANPPQGSRQFAFARIEENGTVSLLHEFKGSDGAPTGTSIAYGFDGNFYSVGNQQYGGVSPGFIYRMTPSGVYSQLASFPAFSTKGSRLPLIAASDGNLYGVFGATSGSTAGTLYQATLSGQLQTVATFPPEAFLPQTLMQASDGNIYVTTNNDFIYRYDLATHQLSVAYHMNASGSQGKCACELVQGMDGKLYGVTPIGGNYPSIGAIFSIDFGLPKPTPVISQLLPASGPVGQKVLLWGQYLLGATSVTFNGAPSSSVAVTSGRSAWVNVPSGATTGPVTITTANGSFTTTSSFTVQ